MRIRNGRTPIAFAIILTVAAVASVLVFRNAETPPWSRAAGSSAVAENTDDTTLEPVTGEFTPFTFIAYNVKNWLVSHQAPEKKVEAKAAIIELLVGGNPDVIGLCEIGSEDDVAEIQRMLKAAGLDLPHFHHAGGVDRVRHLALISRFPILSTESPDLRLAGMEQSMQRGILDATLGIGGRPVRFIGLHLKSKRTVPDFDQAALRIAEAQHARRHLDAILAKDPGAAVVAYGDFNDTTRSMSTRAIYGTYRTPGYMSPAHVRDSRGETWTYRYAMQDAYTRIDFVTVSAGLRRHVKKDKSRIIDDPLWETASDHRPVLVRFE
jgi:endonuclease/exonuclease/phosphatase family metal-dependent hydrolase